MDVLGLRIRQMLMNEAVRRREEYTTAVHNFTKVLLHHFLHSNPLKMSNYSL